MKNLKFGLFGAAMLGGLGNATAADIYAGESLKDTPGSYSSITWTGFYIGIQGGYADGSWDGYPATNPAYGPLGVSGYETDADGWMGGVTVGYNKQIQSFVLGIEGDFSWGDVEGDTGIDMAGLSGGYRWDVEQELDNLATLRGRIGIAYDRFLIYATGGFAFAETSANQTVTLSCPSANCAVGNTRTTAIGSSDENHVGWAAGAGVEATLSRGWSLKAEWLHVDLGEQSYKFSGTANPGTDDAVSYSEDSLPSSLEFDIFRVGLNYRFGSSEQPLK